MADSRLLVPELSEAETMGAETARFEELLLQVRPDQLLGPWVFGGCFSLSAQRWDYSSQNAVGRQLGLTWNCSC